MSNSEDCICPADSICMERSEIDNKPFDLFKGNINDGPVNDIQLGTEILLPIILGVCIGIFISFELKDCGINDLLGNYSEHSILIFGIIGGSIGALISGLLVGFNKSVNTFFKNIDPFQTKTIRDWSSFAFKKLFIFSILLFLFVDLNIVKTALYYLQTPLKIIICLYLLWLILLFINLAIDLAKETKEDNIFINYSDVFNTFLRLTLSISVLFGLFFFIQGFDYELKSMMSKSDNNNLNKFLTARTAASAASAAFLLVLKIKTTIIGKKKIWFETIFVLIIMMIVFMVLKSYTYNKFTIEVRNTINKELFNERCDPSYKIINQPGLIETTYVNHNYKNNYEKVNKKKFICTPDKGSICNLYARDYYWPCSYNTCSIDGANFGGTMEYSVQRVLELGAKVLHLPVFIDYDNMNLVIGMKNNINNTNMPVSDVLTTINKYRNKSYPLVIYFEFNAKDDLGNILLDNLYNNIVDIFTLNNIVSNKYSIYNSNNTKDAKHFGDIPMSEMIIGNSGKISILINKPIVTSTKLKNIIHGKINKDFEYFKLYTLKRNQTIKNINFIHQNAIDHNKSYMSAVFPEQINSSSNILKSGISMFNIGFKTNWEHGCQFVFMNYQLCNTTNKDCNDSNKDILMNYICQFKDKPLIVKPENLRYIPKYPLPPPKQAADLNLAPRSQYNIKGFSANINL